MSLHINVATDKFKTIVTLDFKWKIRSEVTAVKEKFPPLTSSSTSCWSHAESDIYFLLYAVKICASESASLCVCVSVLVQASACVCVHNSICVFPPLPFTLARVEMEVPLPGPTHWTLLRKPLSVGYWTAWMQLKSNMRERERHVRRAQYNQAAAAVARCDPARPAPGLAGTNHFTINGGENATAPGCSRW